MAKGLAILEHIFPDGQVTEGFVGPEKVIELIPKLSERYESLQNCWDDEDHFFDKELEAEEFCLDLFLAWEVSSPLVVKSLGIEKVFRMLELLSVCRWLTWPYDDYERFENLPDTITIYRGGSGNLEEVLKGYSWSQYYGFAEQFAKRENGVVVCGDIQKNNALFMCSTDWEIVPRPGTVVNPRIVSSPAQVQ